MPITINEVRRNLSKFATEYGDAEEERQEAQSFQIAFYCCFGINQRKTRLFEKRVKNKQNTTGYIDGYVPGKLLTEMKSRGVSLDRGHQQASDYAAYMEDEEVPPFILTCNFARFRLYSLDSGETFECGIEELAKNAERFMFLTDNPSKKIVEESPVNKQAAYAIAKLHAALIDSGFTGHDLEVFLTRLLFCLFADDTGIFGERQQFTRLLAATRADGTDVKGVLQTLFEDVLNIPVAKRQKTLDEAMHTFAYVNGDLFKEQTRLPVFDGPMRDALVACDADVDWSEISPAIFGSMFQSVLEEAAGASAKRTASRRELGAHFTSERNILRAINPLFMDDLRAEFEAAKNKRDAKKSLVALYNKLPTITVFDPACGCGNFLVIAYRELRELEHDVITSIWGGQGPELLDISTRIRVTVSQFYGIEIDEAAAHIARVALYITDEQMNDAARERFGAGRATVPISASPHIHCGNALSVNWADILPPEKCSYVVGNPPFVGHQWRTPVQMEDLERIWGKDGRFGRLDYVTCWHKQATVYTQANPSILTAFVSTNSICQGEQVGILWEHLLAQGVQIRFAHRTFQWSNEGRGVAAVHCIIVGFGLIAPKNRIIFDYGDDIKAEPEVSSVENINPYLVDAPNVILPSRTQTPLGLPQLIKGSQPTDGGHLILNFEEMQELLESEPAAKEYLRPYVGGDDLINGKQRWCLWLKGITSKQVKGMPKVMKRVAAVAAVRRKSPTKSVQDFAEKPTLFTQDRQPDADYLGLSEVSSENRRFIPIAFIESNVIASNTVQVVVGATKFHFGILCSTMHNAWMRTVAGRLESRYRYTPSVYNNFPWPVPNDKKLAAIENAAREVLTARALHSDSTLAELYDEPMTCAELVDAHRALDKAVDAAYGYKGGKPDAPRVAFLFELYQKNNPDIVTTAQEETARAAPAPKRKARKTA